MADQKVSALTAETTPLDADIIYHIDTSAGNTSKKITWTTLKAFLKTYFDGIYAVGTMPVKASGVELDALTDDAKFITAKAVQDGHKVPHVAPGTSGNIMKSDGTDWTSAANTPPAATWG